MHFYSYCNAYLRKKVGNNVDVPLEMNMVENAQDNTKCHLRDAQNKGQLHLVAVYKPQLVSGYLPNLQRTDKTLYHCHGNTVNTPGVDVRCNLA